MQQEIEVKFLHVNFEEVRGRLKKVGAVCEQPMRIMRRVVMDYPDRRMQTKNDGWIRIRDEGNKVTLTFKKSIEKKFGGASEIEVEVSDYQKTIDVFKAVGLVVHSEQETKRETWKLGDIEVVLDEWPWLDPFIEIEGTSKEDVMETAELLEFNWDDAVFGSVTTAYREQYPNIADDEHVSVIPKITFDTLRPDWFVKK